MFSFRQAEDVLDIRFSIQAVQPYGLIPSHDMPQPDLYADAPKVQISSSGYLGLG